MCLRLTHLHASRHPPSLKSVICSSQSPRHPPPTPPERTPRSGPWKPGPRTRSSEAAPAALALRPSMEVPGPLVSSKPGETSVKWQLCYDMTAKMWWMVSRGRPPVPGGGSGSWLGEQEGTAGHPGGPRPVFQPLGFRDTWILVQKVRRGWRQWHPLPGHWGHVERWSAEGKLRPDNGEKVVPNTST